MVESIPKEEMKKYYRAFFGIVIICLPLSLAVVYFTVDTHTFSQYITLPSKIEHDRYIFITLYVPLMFLPLVFIGGYTVIMRRKLPEKIHDKLGMFLAYSSCSVLLLTPLFGIVSGFYLDYHGYERCPDNNRGAFSHINIHDYAKSPEYCSPLD